MKHFAIASLVGLTLSFFGAASALAGCDRPSEFPAPPSAATATKADFSNAIAEMKKVNAAIQIYADCLMESNAKGAEKRIKRAERKLKKAARALNAEIKVFNAKDA